VGEVRAWRPFQKGSLGWIGLKKEEKWVHVPGKKDEKKKGGGRRLRIADAWDGVERRGTKGSRVDEGWRGRNRTTRGGKAMQIGGASKGNK